MKTNPLHLSRSLHIFPLASNISTVNETSTLFNFTPYSGNDSLSYNDAYSPFKRYGEQGLANLSYEMSLSRLLHSGILHPGVGGLH